MKQKCPSRGSGILSNFSQEYIDFFFHPFQTHQRLKRKRLELQIRKERRAFYLIKEEQELPLGRPDREQEGLTLTDSLVMSWPFMMAHAFYGILFLKLSFDYFSGNVGGLTSLELVQSRTTLLSVLAEVVFFPFFFWFYAKFWIKIIQLGHSLFRSEEAKEDIINEIVSYSQASHIFLLIPIFGPLMQFASNGVYLYAGLKEGLGLSFIQSMVILLAPLILVAMAILFIVLSFALLLSTL